MKTKKNKMLTMKKGSLKRVLNALYLDADERGLPNSDATQFKLTTPGFKSININFYPKAGEGTVLVQPWDSPLAQQVRTILESYKVLRDHRLRNRACDTPF